MPQCVAVCCSVLQYVAVCSSVLQCVASCYSILQCVLQRVAACCSVLQRVTACGIFRFRPLGRKSRKNGPVVCFIVLQSVAE